MGSDAFLHERRLIAKKINKTIKIIDNINIVDNLDLTYMLKGRTMQKYESYVVCGISINPQDDQKVLKLMSDAKNLPASNIEYQKIHSGYEAFRLQNQGNIAVNKALIPA